MTGQITDEDSIVGALIHIDSKYPTLDVIGQIEPRAISAAKLDIADTIACGLLGRNAPGVKQLQETIESFQTRPESRLWGAKQQMSAPFAALVNAAQAHAYDFDDTHDQAIVHAGVGVVPAAFAEGEVLDGITGREFIRAVVLGVEASCTLGLLTTGGPGTSGWVLSALYAYVGAAIASAILRRLPESQLADALGISYSLMSGNMQGVVEGALTKRLQPAFGDFNGMLATRLAAAGVTGPHRPFFGTFGFSRLYYPLRNDIDPNDLIGHPFKITELSYKPYPCCRFTHPAIDAALEIAAKVSPEQIDHVVAQVSEQAFEAVCNPLERKQHPQTIVDGQFSIPYTVAAALVDRKVEPEHFTPESIHRDDLVSLAQKIEPRIGESASAREIGGVTLEVLLKDGQKVAATVSQASGGPGDDAALWDMIAHKLEMAHVTRQRELLDLFQHLEKIDDMSYVSELLEAICL